MKFDPATLLANPAIRNAIAAETENAERRAHVALMAKQANDAARSKPSRPTIGMKAPAAEANPFLAETWNLSQQAFIANRDPVKADRLKAEAGLADILSPTRVDAERAQSSAAFIARKVSDTVKRQDAPAQAPQAPAPATPPVPVSNPVADLARRALATTRIAVPAERFDALVSELAKVARIADDGSVMLRDERGALMIDWKATTAQARVVDLTPETFLIDLQRERPELFEADAPAQPEARP